MPAFNYLIWRTAGVIYLCPEFVYERNHHHISAIVAVFVAKHANLYAISLYLNGLLLNPVPTVIFVNNLIPRHQTCLVRAPMMYCRRSRCSSVP